MNTTAVLVLTIAFCVLFALVAWCLVKLDKVHSLLFQTESQVTANLSRMEAKISSDLRQIESCATANLRKVESQATTNLRQVMSQTFATERNSFAQIESLFGLYKDLDFEFSLPHSRGFPASPDFLQAVHHTIKRLAPKVVVECSSGMSTLIVAKTLQQIGAGHVYSLESDRYYCDVTRALLEKHKVAQWATVIHAPLTATEINGKSFQWYDTSALANIEGVAAMIIDGPFGGISSLARYPAGPQLFSKLQSGAEVLVDDYNRPDEKRMVELWLEQFSELKKTVESCEKGCARLVKR